MNPVEWGPIKPSWADCNVGIYAQETRLSDKTSWMLYWVQPQYRGVEWLKGDSVVDGTSIPKQWEFT